jgi:hypothetical protein
MFRKCGIITGGFATSNQIRLLNQAIGITKTKTSSPNLGTLCGHTKFLSFADYFSLENMHLSRVCLKK